jgi:Mrp family chromosome partitioning ATPase
MIVEKSVKMAKEMDIPVLGLVENMSYYVCPDCGKKHEIFGPSHVEEAAKEFEIDTFAKLPIEPAIAQAIDEGRAEGMKIEHLDPIITKITDL